MNLQHMPRSQARRTPKRQAQRTVPAVIFVRPDNYELGDGVPRETARFAPGWGKLVKQIRTEELRLNGPQFAKLAGISKQALSDIESGKTKSVKGVTLTNLCRALRITAPELMSGRRGEPVNYDRTVEPGPEVSRQIPLISWVQAGSWSNIVDNFAPGDAEEWHPSPVPCGARSYILRVRGVSMEPVFRDGELIFVDPDKEPTHKSFVIVRLDDREEATFKQLIIEGGKRYLKPLNPNWPDQIIEVNEHATICGVVYFRGSAV